MDLILYIDSLDAYASAFFKKFIDYSPRLVSAFIILFVGLYAIRLINRLVKRLMNERELDPTLTKFLADILLWTMRVLLFITFISRLGIESTSFVAILGAAGLAIGMALQGSLSNFAGGVLIVLFKPFRVGDTIEAQGVIGTVNEIQIFATKLLAANNQTIFVPNGILSNGTIINYSMENMRRADLTLSVSYDTNIGTAKDLILDILNKNPKILKTPAPVVAVRELTPSAILLAIRPWSKIEDFGDMTSDVLQDVKTAFDQAEIAIQPYNVEVSKK